MTKEQFRSRWRGHFYDPAFDSAPAELERLTELAWHAYDESRKSPRTRKAGSEFADPEFDLPIEWLDARRRIQQAAERHRAVDVPSRILLICASPRTDETCPGEMSKTFRLVSTARDAFGEMSGCEVDLLDLSRLTAEYGRTIFPCKACVSTAMPLCHWPCSCYPNHAMGQVNDWMHEIYPRWVEAHGVMIVTPVHWYQAPSVLKLMIDRLVCADGGNPDPTTTCGKSPEKAKALELTGWPYPKHLGNRAFSVIVHGDAAGAEAVRRGLHDWLTDMTLVPAGGAALIDRYVGYYEPYAVSHDALDRDAALIEEVRNAARTLASAVARLRAGIRPTDERLKDPRPK
ncbi:MAG: flavodoxin family protein [Acidobacteria bacterium]|nr:flavodoxin family protein [Acidobacteriota bacterium]